MHRATLAAAGCALAAAIAAPSAAFAAPKADKPDRKTEKAAAALQSAVTVNGMLRHAREFQGIADRSGGTRASGTPGYDRSAAYVADRLRAAGYAVTVQPFSFPYFQETAPSQFERVSPAPRVYGEEDFATMEYSGSGDVTAPLTPVDVVIPPGDAPNTSTSGCEPADFAGFPAGDVALVQRGSCSFATKAANAEAAGASAVVVFNEGQPGRTDAVAGTLGGPDASIPVLGASYAVGEELVQLAEAGQTTVHVVTSTLSETRMTANVLADSPTGNTGRTVVVGAHLDSVVEGPGINDNGSGSAQNLEIAEELPRALKKPRNAVRFAFWGAEESGLLGSEHYVESLSQEQRDAIMANLNFDMVGSPNYVRFVYDGDGSAFGNPGPVGSDIIESLFVDAFGAKGLPTEPTAFDGRSDYGPFIAVGIPAGGTFSGAEGIKTPEQAATYGGTAGEAYDPCYHQACDTLANLDHQALSEFSDAAADVTVRLLQREAPLTAVQTLARRTATEMPFKGPHAVR
ncbi:M28 family metallopeptidase [Paraconexibacter sp.]|uniref:M28 family metallopeptidase n=1 Tax=Paraconexibacter sp. TaxID=2949640 RepID=UPI003569910A